MARKRATRPRKPRNWSGPRDGEYYPGERVDPALEQDDSDSPASDAKAERLKRARASFKAIQDSESKQREREREDIKFYDGDQWPEDVKIARAGQNANNGLPPVPARPCLVFNQARQSVRQVLNQGAQSELGITLVPADDFGGLGSETSELEIELREGLTRRIQRTSDAQSARDWGCERGIVAGRGYWGVMTRFGDGKTRDKEIYVRRFYNQGAVSLGPHELPDGSDAEEAFVGSFIPLEQAIQEYSIKGTPNEIFERIASDDEAFRTEMEAYGKEWLVEQGDGDHKRKMIHVCEHWWTERDDRVLVFLNDGRDVWEDELTDADKALIDDPDTGKPVGRRTVIEKQIKFEIIVGGTQSFDETDWEGHYIPIIEYIGDELQPYDSERRFEGMVRPGISSGIGTNVMISKLVETVGLTPIPSLILDPESIEGYEDWYKLAATRALPYLPQRTRGDDGREFREAHRPSVDPNLQPLSVAIQVFQEFNQITMGIHEPTTGKVDPRLKSGKAIEAVVAQDAHGTSNFIDNRARSVHYEGLIINDLLFPIYGRPGRLAKMIGRDNEMQTVPLHQPFVMQDGKHQLVPDGTEGAKTYTLTEGARVNVAIKVTKQADLRRQETAEFLSQLIQSNPEKFMAEFGDMFFNVLDVPEHKEMAERAKLMLAPPILQMLDAKKQGQDIPPVVMQQLAQKDQQLKELSQIAHGMQQKIDTDETKYRYQERIELAKLKFQAEKTEADNETKIAVAELSAKVDRLALFMEERARLGIHAHEGAMAASDAAHEADMMQMEHRNALEQGAQAAALAPEPSPNGSGA